MIHIVGGAYLEKCIEPSWEQLFGSGVRGAGALTSLNDAVHLTTYIDAQKVRNLQITAGALNFTFEAEQIEQTLTFNYFHCLSNPSIQPDVSHLEKQKPLQVNAQNVIRYGFLEGDAVVKGEKVVYDPQNDYASELFSANGSTAQHLAIIANANECRKMTGSPYNLTNPEILGKELLKLEKAEVVIVKQGSLGAMVVTADKIQSIPAYRTERVFSIGSGDVFTAIFAHFWIFGDKTPFESANEAVLLNIQV